MQLSNSNLFQIILKNIKKIKNYKLNPNNNNNNKNNNSQLNNNKYNNNLKFKLKLEELLWPKCIKVLLNLDITNINILMELSTMGNGSTV